MTFGGVEKVII